MSAGSALGSLTNILIVGAVWAVFGIVILKLNQFIATQPMGADALGLITILEVAYGFIGIIYLIAVVVNHWINSKNMASQQV